MATDGDLLLAAIRANTWEDTPRLMYADWLEEQGEGVRAVYIREKVKLQEVYEVTRLGPSDSLEFRGVTVAKGDRRLKGGGVYPDGNLYWHRGFCFRAEVHSESMNWVPYICKDHPIEEVRLVDKEPAASEDWGWVWEPGYNQWRADQVPFYIAKAGKWKAKMEGGLMFYAFPTSLEAYEALDKAVSIWGHEMAAGFSEGWDKEE